MRQRRNNVSGRVARAGRLAVFALAAAAVLGSAMRGWPERLYAQAPAPAAPTAPQSTTSSTEPEENVAAFRRITNKVLCQCGSCSYTALSCNHLNCNSAAYIRRVVKESLAQGKSEEVILAGFVEQYGPKVLPEPPRQGFAFMAWLMPYVALGLGIFAVMFVLTRLRKRPALAGDGAAEEVESTVEATPELVEKYREQIERELRKP
jgi:cytochrome c-type biogenesis protein CcmH